MNKITVTLTQDTVGNWLVEHEGSSAYYQQDWDYPGLASALGWDMKLVGQDPDCGHPFTDGTVDCKECGTLAYDFILNAGDWLAENEGEIEIPESAYDSIAWCREE